MTKRASYTTDNMIMPSGSKFDLSIVATYAFVIDPSHSIHGKKIVDRLTEVLIGSEVILIFFWALSVLLPPT